MYISYEDLEKKKKKTSSALIFSGTQPTCLIRVINFVKSKGSVAEQLLLRTIARCATSERVRRRAGYLNVLICTKGRDNKVWRCRCDDTMLLAQTLAFMSV